MARRVAPGRSSGAGGGTGAYAVARKPVTGSTVRRGGSRVTPGASKQQQSLGSIYGAPAGPAPRRPVASSAEAAGYRRSASGPETGTGRRRSRTGAAVGGAAAAVRDLRLKRSSSGVGPAAVAVAGPVRAVQEAAPSRAGGVSEAALATWERERDRLPWEEDSPVYRSVAPVEGAGNQEEPESPPPQQGQADPAPQPQPQPQPQAEEEKGEEEHDGFAAPREPGPGPGEEQQWSGAAATLQAPAAHGVSAGDAPWTLPALETGPDGQLRVRGLVGLGNLGNTCFMNASLQCLSTIPALAQVFLAHGDEDFSSLSTTKGRFAACFGDLIRRLWGGRPWGSERPTELKRMVGTLASRFVGYEQQDAQEFLRFLLDGLHEDMNRVRVKLPYKEIPDREGESDAVKSALYWDYYAARNDSPVKDLFCGQIRSQVTCQTCKKRSTCFDIIWDLSIPIPKASQSSDGGGGGLRRYSAAGRSAASCSLDECLRAFTEEELLKGSDAYYCSRCKAHRTSVKQMALYRCPPVLVLHVKRFSYTTFSRDKLGTRVAFPRADLDLAPYCVEASAEGPLLYDLVGVVNHLGGMGGGHYTADCLNYDSQRWYNYNDSHVSEQDGDSLDGGLAYLLFYQRRDMTVAVSQMGSTI